MEYFFNCPYCDAEISMVFELISKEQSTLEDCEVCCRPIEVAFEVEDGEISNFEAKTTEE